MNCLNCGNLVGPEDLFCSSCGHAIPNTETGDNFVIKTEKVISIKKKLLKILIPVISVSFILLIGTIAIISNITTKLSLKDYIAKEIVFEGINGYGSIEVENLIDLEALSIDLIEDMERAEAIWEETDLDPSVLLATNYIEFELSENNGTLSNGDVITLTASIDKEGIKNNIFYTKSLMGRKSQSFEFVVYGLEDGVILDVFDAIDCCYYDTTNETNSYYIQLKDDYSKDYNNGVTIVTENDEIKVYGEDFYSFSIPISFMSDKVSKDAKETKIQVDISYDSHIDKGIIIKETEKNITIDKLTYIKSNIFKENDLNILQKHALEFAAKKFDINKYHLSEVTLFTGGNLKSQALIYFFKGSDGVYIVFYEYLKCDTKDKVFNVANVEPQTRSGILWGTYKYSSMDKFYSETPSIKGAEKTAINIIK